MLKLEYTQDKFSLFYKNQLKLFHHNDSLPLIHLGIGEAEYAEKMGSFFISEDLKEKSGVENFKVLENNKEKIVMEFILKDFAFIMHVVDENSLMKIYFEKIPPQFNRFWINIAADKDESVYGCGEQYSEFNLKHQKVPLWVQEQGVGRKGFTAFLANLIAKAGGSKFHTYYPQPTFVSLNNYFCHIDQSAYGEIHFQAGKSPIYHHRMHFFQIPNAIYFGVYENFQETVASLNKFLGIQPKLPDWVYSGMWLAIQGEGGISKVESRLKKALNAGVKVNAVWSQDWQGILKTSFGTQLFWDWKWNGPNREIRFPNFPQFVKKINQMGIRYMGYINPFLYEKGELFQEAEKNGYLVKNKDGTTFLTKTTTFNVGLLDLTNPEVRSWIKSVIKKNMIEEAGLSGWMADFGEYLPIDCVLHSGENPEIIHNLYPVLWDQVNLEALKEAGKLGENVFFTRSGYTGSSKYSTLVWGGDQLVNWEYHDGLASVIPAMLSLGMSGIGYYCSDIGGYTSLAWIKRSKELFIRWAEQACFTMVMRTHEGNRPEKCWQFDSDDETLNYLARMTGIHVMLAPYLQKLSEDYQNRGLPPARSLVMNYPEDPKTYSIKYQYLLGNDLLVAPVLQKKKNKWRVYLPDDSWIHLWTKKEYGRGNHKIAAPLGFPPVFYRKDSKFLKIFEEIHGIYGTKSNI